MHASHFFFFGKKIIFIYEEKISQRTEIVRFCREMRALMKKMFFGIIDSLLERLVMVFVEMFVVEAARRRRRRRQIRRRRRRRRRTSSSTGN
jgi:hypothetical protein